MKKLLVLVLPIAIGIAIFTVSCTPTSVEETYENDIQLIDKDEAIPPDDRRDNNE